MSYLCYSPSVISMSGLMEVQVTVLMLLSMAVLTGVCGFVFIINLFYFIFLYR